jgi:hypothetical protein
MSRSQNAFVATVALALGLLCLVWGRQHWPGAWLVRGYLGDVVIIVFLVAALGVVWPSHATARLVGVVGLAVAAELFQTWHHVRGAAGVALGTTFDPYDLVAYAVGAAIAWYLMRSDRT